MRMRTAFAMVLLAACWNLAGISLRAESEWPKITAEQPPRPKVQTPLQYRIVAYAPYGVHAIVSGDLSAKNLEDLMRKLCKASCGTITTRKSEQKGDYTKERPYPEIKLFRSDAEYKAGEWIGMLDYDRKCGIFEIIIDADKESMGGVTIDLDQPAMKY